MCPALHGNDDIKGIVGCRVVSVFSVGEDDSVLPSPEWVTHRGGQRQRHTAKNERMVEPVPLG